MPHNFLHLGLINLLFPNAKVIHCNRNPLDTCLSCYIHDFTSGHDYSYDLHHLGHYYNQYQRLMKHWRSTIKLPFLDVQYEDLITDQENMTRKILAFCDLDWDDHCLRFYENKRFVNTLSYDQVRKPIYKSSVERWKFFEPHLEELKKGLAGH